MSGLALALTGLGSVVALMTVVWAISVVRRNATLVDGAWGLAFVVLGWTYVVAARDPNARSFLAVALTSAWGLRLSAYLSARAWRSGEDWRYAERRGRVGRPFAFTSLLTIFLPQALAVWGVGVPLAAAVRSGQPGSLGLLDLAGAVVWATGFLIEAVADLQLGRFRARADREGRVLDRGLWRYSRHPNYFGDAVQWWGLGLIGLAAGAWWALLGPLGMTVVLLRVTGVSATDRHLRQSRGSAYEDYMRRTSAFVPLPPRE